jgi:8-amino-7-oxononanoate synthase
VHRVTRDWRAWTDEQLETIRTAGQSRQPRDFDAHGPAGTIDGRDVVSFASNDYLGLTQHPDVVAAAIAAVERWGTGSGSARLIVGSRPCHSELERELAEWKRTESAVLFPTGFATNLGVLTTFGAAGTLVLSDELNHASIIDGCRLARAEVHVYGHADADHVEAMLANHGGPAIVVTDSVFSMDGDIAPVDDLARICAQHGALLIVDEAHAVLGPDPDLSGVDAIRIGTLSKTLSALGGFAAGTRAMTELVVNRARSYIFTTASSPADTAAATAALRVLRSEEGHGLRCRLRSLVDRVVPGHPSPIIPVVVGHEDAAVKAAAALFDRGLLVPAIRPPTVPPGSSRLRVALSASHTDEQIGALIEGLDACVPEWRG